MAYRKLGVVLSNARMPEASRDSFLTRAYRFRDHLTDRERLQTIGTYYGMGPERDRVKAAAAYRELLAMDPDDRVGRVNLGVMQMEVHNFALAESLFRKELETPEPGTITYMDLIGAARLAGNDSLATRLTAETRRRYPNVPANVFLEVPHYYESNELDSAGQLLVAAQRTTSLEQRGYALGWLRSYSLLRGRVGDWHRYSSDLTLVNGQRGSAPQPLVDSVMSAIVDIAIRGQSTSGVARLDATLTRMPMSSIREADRPYMAAAVGYAMAGRPDKARSVLDAYSSQVKDPAVRRNSAPDLHDALGEIALAEHHYKDALVEFARGDTAADGLPVICTTCYSLRAARVYDAEGDRDSAIAAYERYLRTRLMIRGVGEMLGATEVGLRSGVFKRLGELYEAKGDATHAAANYRLFISAWNDADPDLQPVVADVRRRLTKLTGDQAGSKI